MAQRVPAQVQDGADPALAEIGRQLRGLRTGAALTLEKTAQRMGWSKAHMSRIESGQRRISKADHDRLVRILGARPGRAGEAGMSLAGAASAPAQSPKPPPGYVTIPRLNVQASAGAGSLINHEQVVEYLAFDEGFVRRVLQRPRENLLMIEARGDSMEPTIREGDLLIVDISTQERVEHSRLYVLLVEDNLLVKRIQQQLDGALLVISDNDRYAPERVARKDLESLRILGQVIWVAGPPRA